MSLVWHLQSKIDALKYWLKEYKVDGFRFDLVKGLAPNEAYQGANTDSYISSRVERMKELHKAMKEVNPRAYHINELLGTSQEENEMALDGELNWNKMSDDAALFATGQVAGLLGFDAIKWNRVPHSTVSYAESHDEERLAYKQKSSGVIGVKGNHGVMMRRLGSLAASMILRPGAHMIWQFGELGNDQTTKKSNGENNTDPKYVRWSYLEDSHRHGLFESYRQLISLRLENSDLFDSNATITTHYNVSNWNSGFYMVASHHHKEMVVAINPTISPLKNFVVSGVNGVETNDYVVASSSYGVSQPTFDVSGGVMTITSLPAHSYVVITKECLNEIAQFGDEWMEPEVYVTDRSIYVKGKYETLEIYALSGRKMPSHRVTPGMYIVNVDGKSKKVLVK